MLECLLNSFCVLAVYDNFNVVALDFLLIYFCSSLFASGSNEWWWWKKEAPGENN